MPPTPPSLGHNAIMLGLLEVVMLNVGQSAMGRVHAIRDRWFKATLWHSTSTHVCFLNHDPSQCVILCSRLDFGCPVPLIDYQCELNAWLGGLVGERDLESFNMASTLRTFPGFDISLRFHHSMGFPVAQHVQKMMALGTLAGVPDVLGQELLLLQTRYCTSNKWLTPQKHA